MKNVWVSALAVMLAIGGIGRVEAAYELIDLGTLGGLESWAVAVNDGGTVVGSARDSGQIITACEFDTTGQGNNLSWASISGESAVTSVNSSGIGAGYIANNSITTSAVRFDASEPTGVVDLGTLGGDSAMATGINSSGAIVGYARNQTGNDRATLFDSTGNGANIDLGALGGLSSQSMAIDNAGQIVGWAENVNGDTHGVIFDATGNGANTDLGTLGGDTSTAMAVDNGVIVGYAATATDAYHAVLFDADNTSNNLDLGTLGGDFSIARAINGSLIVGAATTTDGETHATLFDATGAGYNIDLNSFIDPASGWVLTSAQGINADGWIVGYGHLAGAQYIERAFLLKPVPEPASLALLVCGSMAVWRRQRKNRRK